MGGLLGGEPAPPVALVLEHGCLSRRIVDALGGVPAGTPVDPERLREVYARLCRCLATGQPFRADA